MKDWNKICADLSDVSDDDAHDIPNVVSMQKNVHKVVELIRETAAKKAAVSKASCDDKVSATKE